VLGAKTPEINAFAGSFFKPTENWVAVQITPPRQRPQPSFNAANAAAFFFEQLLSFFSQRAVV
jgi:hypothetical protein